MGEWIEIAANAVTVTIGLAGAVELIRRYKLVVKIERRNETTPPT